MATFYIDPTSPTNGVGSEVDPYNAWPSTASNNTYLQKRGTTANANVTAFGRSNLIFGAYGSGTDPIINGGAGVAFSASNSSNVALSNFDLRSTGSHAFSWNGGNSLTVSDCTMVGSRTGGQVVSAANPVTGVTLRRVVARHTVVTNEQSGLFVAAQSGNALLNVTIEDSTFNGSATNGLQVKAGDANSSASISGLTLVGCSFNDNGDNGLLITTGMTALDENKVVTNSSVVYCQALRNGGVGMALCIRGGHSVVAWNQVNENNWAGITGTGGLQLTGAYGVSCYGNVCSRNYTTFEYDGVGLYLDTCTGTLNNVGTEYCTVFGNWCEGNVDFSPDAADISSSTLSAGIATYKSYNNVISGNVCINNACGVCLGSWSPNNKVLNNTLVGNKFGVAILWNQSSHGNIVKNNIIKGSASHALLCPATVTRASAGDITLSGMTGLVTVTSSVSAFATHSTGYAISAGDGYGYVVSKTSNTVVVIKVLSAFSGTSFANGAWTITGGQDQGAWSDQNSLSANTNDVYAGSGQSLVIGANSITVDPLLTSDYRLTAASPCLAAGARVSDVRLRDFYGKEIDDVPDIGALQRYVERELANPQNIAAPRTLSSTGRTLRRVAMA